MLKLIKPNEKYYKQYKEMMDEWNMEGSRIAPWPLHLKYHTEEYFKEMLFRVKEVEKGENLGEYAYKGNIGSWKVMEKCGGKFENIVIEEETGLPVKRYWIDT